MRFYRSSLVLIVALLASCSNGSDFNSSGGGDGNSTDEEQTLPYGSESQPSYGHRGEYGSDSSAPSHAVSIGSFSAWTIPEDPVPNHAYVIRIEVRLPDVPSEYNRDDIRGSIIGTDGFRLDLGDRENSSFQYYEGIAQLSVNVPGAVSNVHDVIRISSGQLGETQTLTLVF